MAEVKTYLFDYREVAEALIKKQGIHEGLWGIYMEFGIAAGNIPAGPSEGVLLPAAIVPVVKVGIQRFDKPSSLTVDAGEVNPPPRIDSAGPYRPPSTSRSRRTKERGE